MIKANHLVFLGLIATSAQAVEVIDKNASPLVTEIGAIYNDRLNPTVEQDSDAYGFAIEPSGQLIAEGEGYAVKWTYAASFKKYELNEDVLDDSQDFLDFSTSATTRFYLSPSWFVDAQLGIAQDEQEFGYGLSRLRSNVLIADKLSRQHGFINLVYGSDTSNRYMSFKFGIQDDEFDPNNSYSTLFDKEQQYVQADLAFRQSALTSYMLKLEYSEDDFESTLREDSTLLRALIGMSWKPTGKTKIDLLLGMYQRSFDVDEDSSGLSWQLDIESSPREDLVIGISSSRNSAVSDSELANETIKDSWTAFIEYLYSEQWRFGIEFNHVDSDFESPASTNNLREQFIAFSVSANIKDHSVLDLHLGRNKVTADAVFPEFDQNEARLNWLYEF